MFLAELKRTSTAGGTMMSTQANREIFATWSSGRRALASTSAARDTGES
jgi:hypothetical protein